MRSSSQITRWVTETILAQDDQKKRASIVKHFIAIAEVSFSSDFRIFGSFRLTEPVPIALLVIEQLLNLDSHHRWSQLDSYPSATSNMGERQSKIDGITRSLEQHHAT